MSTNDDILRRVHLIGIGGDGMGGLATYLADMGREVSGSDLRWSPNLDRLANSGIKIYQEHDSENLGSATLVVASDAIEASNVELEEARIRDLTIFRRAECLDYLGRSKRSIFVAGSHGKSTTSAMIANVLAEVAAETSFIVGADVPSLNFRRAKFAAGEFLVCEACEAFQNLAPLHPFIAIITNIDDDHIEHYGSQLKIDQAFRDFVERVHPLGIAVVNGDDAGVLRAFAGYKDKLYTFGLSPTNDLAADSVVYGAAGSRFDVLVGGHRAGTIDLTIPGRHAVSNALACVATCLRLGLSFDQISAGLARFSGVLRRWDDYGIIEKIRLVDDYAHHPTELRASIETARLVATSGQRLVIAFQPQLFSRTQRLFQEFARVLATSDHVLLLEIDPGGERDRNAVQSSLIGDEIRRLGGVVDVIEDVDDLLDRFDQLLRPGDFLLLAGAGAIGTAASRVRKHLQARSDKQAFAKSRLVAFRRRIEGWIRRLKTTSVMAQSSKSVLTMFRSHVARVPNQHAVSDSRRNVTYLELDIASDKFASVLKSREVNAGSVVGVCAASSIELLVVIIAAAKLGAAYLPLDPGLPVERVRFMLAQTHSSLLVAGIGSHVENECADIQKVNLEEAKSVLDECLDRDFSNSRILSGEPSLASDSIAYICFTSGSTGKPKGVAITHASLHALTEDIVQRFDIGSRTTTALNTSISFDVSLAEIWMTLAGGGQLFVTEAERPLVGARLAEFLETNNISHLAVTPSVLGSMPFKSLPNLSWIICAGEACPGNLVNMWAPGRRFINAYGPTEATIYATVAECISGEKVTIGKPLKHARTYVMDSNLRPVSPDQIGELCLGGASVARGYLGLDKEANQQFCGLYENGVLVDWIYRTGDLVKVEEDGNLSYLGRLDDQVKINGNRIEIEEVEQSVLALGCISNCVVATSKIGHSTELVCFVVMESAVEFSADAIRDHLGKWLPAYMIPARFVDVDAMPMTPSGKKDRRLLVETHKRKFTRRPFYSSARTAVEMNLVSIWKDVLEVKEDIGVYDDFGSLGGDSLRSLILIGEIELKFGVSVPPGHFKRITTIENLALRIEDLVWRVTPSAGMSASGFFASRIYQQQRHLIAGWGGDRINDCGLICSIGKNAPRFEIFLCVQYEEEIKLLSEHLGGDVRIHGMRSGHLIMPYTDINVECLSSHYLEEMSAIRPSGQIVLCGICQGGTIVRAMAKKLSESNGSPPFLVLIEQARLSEYQGNVAFFYSEESYLNPFQRFETGLARYDQVYADRYTIDIVPGPHGSFHRQPYVHHFVAKLKARLDKHFGPD